MAEHLVYNIYTVLFYVQYLQGVRPSSFMSDRILPGHLVTFTVNQRVLAVNHVSWHAARGPVEPLASWLPGRCPPVNHVDVNMSYVTGTASQ